MSDTASLELSTELQQLSGWVDIGRKDGVEQYTAGYLLRKLPVSVSGGKWKLTVYKDHHNGFNTDWYVVAYVHINSQIQASLSDKLPDKRLHMSEAETLEDALCKLTVELFKEGILPISGRDL